MIIENIEEVEENSIPLRPFPQYFRNNLILKGKESNIKLLKIRLITGRTHQIRLQLSAERLTVVGDWLYGSDPDISFSWSSIALCCTKLSFTNPITNIKHDYILT